tara:strand:+ start:264 stop:533 length:270 start_codon:yes stop_codon:yes gene_type:complete
VKQKNPKTKKKKSNFLNALIDGLLPALPFGNVITEIKNNIKEDGYTPTGTINWPKLTVYITASLLVLGRMLGVISNADVLELVSILQGL